MKSRRVIKNVEKTNMKNLVKTSQLSVAYLLRHFITLAHLGPGGLILGYLSFSDLESLRSVEKALQEPSTLAMLKQFALQPTIVGKTAQNATRNQPAVKYPEAKTVLRITEEVGVDIKIRINEMQRLLNFPVHCEAFRNLNTTPYTSVELNELKLLAKYKSLFDRHSRYNFEIRDRIQDNPVAADLIYKNRILKATCSDLIAQSKKADSSGLKIVMKYFQDIDHRDENGMTALASAAANGHIENVKLLVQAGADITKTCHIGTNWLGPTYHTPMQFAERHEHFEVTRFLSQKEKEKEKEKMMTFGVGDYEEERPSNVCCIM